MFFVGFPDLVFHFLRASFLYRWVKNLFLNRGMDLERCFDLIEDRFLVFFGLDLLEQLLYFLVVALQKGQCVIVFWHFYLLHIRRFALRDEGCTGLDWLIR